MLLQFLSESMVLCLAGGALGLAVGFGGSELLRRIAGWQMLVTSESVLLAIGSSSEEGLFFGLWPARRAVALEPIEALRYE